MLTSEYVLRVCSALHVFSPLIFILFSEHEGVESVGADGTAKRNIVRKGRDPMRVREGGNEEGKEEGKRDCEKTRNTILHSKCDSVSAF